MWNNNSSKARRDVLQWANKSAGAFWVVAAVVSIASVSSSSSSSTTTIAATTSTRSGNNNQRGGFLSPSSLHFWKRTNDENDTSTSSQKPVVTPAVTPKYEARAASSERNTISALSMMATTAGRRKLPLHWFRLDDGVMGGQSTSDKTATVTDPQTGNADILHFTGTINTNGGGFTSIRAVLPNGILTRKTTGIKICFRGDGKTYKLLLSDGGGRQTPSWQANLPTKKSTTTNDNEDDEQWQELIIPFTSFIPNVGVGRNRKTGSEHLLEEGQNGALDPVEMKQIGLMLSLLLADGQPNPQTTFGSGIFNFSLQVRSIEPVVME
jgi:Complex I intermediate-associated protein 30 (CIA30)